MIEVTIDSIRVSLLSQNRIVVLKEESSESVPADLDRTVEADAITLQLQGMEAPRPLTHDLLKSVIETLGAEVMHILISSLERNTYYARIVPEANGGHSRNRQPAQRCNRPCRAGQRPDLRGGRGHGAGRHAPEEEMNLTEEGAQAEVGGETDAEDLGAFKDLSKAGSGQFAGTNRN